MRRKLLGIVAVLLLVAAVGFAATPSSPGPRHRTIITQVATDTAVGQLVIFGSNFCNDPDVTLADDDLDVLSASRGGPIIATLPGAAGAGDFLLTVDCGVSPFKSDSWNLTIGATGSGGGLSAPAFQSAWISVPVGATVPVNHGLATPTENQLVDVLLVETPAAAGRGVVPNNGFVTNIEPNSLNLINPFGPEARTFLVRIWTW